MNREQKLAVFGVSVYVPFMVLGLFGVILPDSMQLSPVFWGVFFLLAVVVFLMDEHKAWFKARKMDPLYYYAVVGLPIAMVWVWGGVSELGPAVMGYVLGGWTGSLPRGIQPLFNGKSP